MSGPTEERRSSRPPPPPEALEPLADGYLANLRYDAPASVVVFLVALPLCLGIAVASDAPPLAGLVTGILGGVVVAWVSGSALAVSGPAAGLATIVAAAVAAPAAGGLGYEGFLLAVALAGLIQIGLGFARAGLVAYYFPNSVIKAMLAGIGLILILKQIPHATGFDDDWEGDLTLFHSGLLEEAEAWRAALSHVGSFFDAIHLGASVIAIVGVVVLIVWPRIPVVKDIRWLPAPLVVVTLGVVLNQVFLAFAPAFAMRGDHLVRLPTGGVEELIAEMSFPEFGRILDGDIWTSAFTIAIVASIETLLCIEAIDKLDNYKRSTPTNRELMAQGLGNMLAGLIGGLPMTAVIVRGSANMQSGARTRMSAFLHGLLLLLAVVLLPWLMNMIPLAALAAVLLHVGYKLARFELFRHMLRQSVDQWAPFLVTVVAILLTDLLKGVGIGLAVAVFFLLRNNLKVPYFVHRREQHEEVDGEHIHIELSENVSFLNKASVNKVLHELPDHSVVEIDGGNAQYIHPDVLELIHEFHQTAHTRKIEVTLTDIPDLGHTAPAH